MTKDFSGMLCNFYIVALTALLPLYTRGTYVMLGDDKYTLFLNVSLLCLMLAAVTALAGWLMRAVDVLWPGGGKMGHSQRIRTGHTDLTDLLAAGGLSLMDVCVLLYGLAAVVSALCSSYGAVAWTGYQDWHMGAVSQLIFVGIYFFVSRQYQGAPWPVYLWEAAFFLVTALGFCSRLGWDPLGLLEGFNSGDWEYSHLISTAGNINWFCGYCSVALAMPAAGYLKGKSLEKQALLFVVSLSGLLILCIQGSDVGPVLAAVCIGVCLLWSRRDAERLRRTLLLAAGVVWGLPCYSGLAAVLGETAFKAVPADGLGLNVLGWCGWWLVGLVCLGLYVLLGRISGNEKAELSIKTGSVTEVKRARKRYIGAEHGNPVKAKRLEVVVNGLWLGMVLLALAALLIVGVWYLSGLSGSDGWISGRSALWRLSWQGFLQGDWKQKLLGAGPDCFAEYIYSTFAPSELPVVEGHWAEAVFTNAHNQWLNHLVNTGLFGLVCAAGVFVTAFGRYRRFLPGMLALAMYGVNSLVSFQQVLSTPLFFLMLGICEYSVRHSSD